MGVPKAPSAMRSVGMGCDFFNATFHPYKQMKESVIVSDAVLKESWRKCSG